MNANGAKTLDEILVLSRFRRAFPPPAERLRLREAAMLTQDEVADVLGVTRATVSRWETGDRQPEAAVLEPYGELLQALALEVDA